MGTQDRKVHAENKDTRYMIVGIVGVVGVTLASCRLVASHVSPRSGNQAATTKGTYLYSSALPVWHVGKQIPPACSR